MEPITVIFGLQRSTKNYHIYEAPQGMPLIGKLYVAIGSLPDPRPEHVQVVVQLPPPPFS